MTMARALQPGAFFNTPLCSRGDVTLCYVFNGMRYQDNKASDTLTEQTGVREHLTSSDDLSIVPSTVEESVEGLGWRRFYGDLWWLETAECEGSDGTSIAGDTASQRGLPQIGRAHV